MVPEVAIPFACYCGFSELYLLGCDCSQNGYAFADPIRGVETQRVLEKSLPSYEKNFKAKTPHKNCQHLSRLPLGLLPENNSHGGIEMQLTDKRAWLFVGYYTPDKNYFSLAKRMQESVQKQGFECQIFERPSALCLRRPPMPWVLNCAQCAEFCLEQFEANPERSIFYLDADAEMLREPELLLSLSCQSLTLA